MKKRTKVRIRRWVLNLHLYGGLAAFWYLLVYGVSSLSFNHPWLLPAGGGEPVRWESPFSFPDISGDLELARAARDELGLMGWPLPWAMRRDGNGDLRFEMSRPGKKYQIHLDKAAGVARVEAESTGLGSVFHILHGSTEGVPNAGFFAPWGVYTEFTTWYVLFAAASGVYLWASRAREKRLALGVLLGSLGLSGLLMGYVYFAG